MSRSSPLSGISPPPTLLKWSMITLLSNKEEPSGLVTIGILPRGFRFLISSFSSCVFAVINSNFLSIPALKAAILTLRTYGDAGLKLNLYINTSYYLVNKSLYIIEH